jgi:hypothetical protein
MEGGQVDLGDDFFDEYRIVESHDSSGSEGVEEGGNIEPYTTREGVDTYLDFSTEYDFSLDYFEL